MKKIIFSMMMLVLAVLLVACGQKVDTSIKFVVADYSEAVLGFESDVSEEEFHEAQTVNGVFKIKFYSVHASTGAKLFDGLNVKPISKNTTDQLFVYKINGFDVEVPYFIIDEESSESILALSVKSEALKYQKGANIETVDKELITTYRIPLNGDDKVLVPTSNINLSGDWQNITSDNKFFEGNANVTVQAGTLSQSFQIRIDGGEDPITWETSNWWGKITSYPIAWVTSFFAGLFNHSFAMGVILATILVRTLAWPIYARSNDMSAKMNQANPELQRIQAKYALKKDPQSQQKMQMETMQVYKKYGLGLSGCLMPFLQMPIFIAMYQVVRRISIPGGRFAADVENTMFLGINLAKDGGFFNYLFAALVGLTMFLLQKISAKKPDYLKKTGTQVKTEQAIQQEKTMKMVMIVMIGMMTVTAATSTALAFYWIIGNLYSLGQTLINKKLQKIKYEKEHKKAII